ncbi:MAG: ribosomal protein L7/L12 [Candidatus Sericytochromatia bacterium]|nr:ribosomal protein L7/L12 [Candidatus Sericytochromatia bacterium]
MWAILISLLITAALCGGSALLLVHFCLVRVGEGERAVVMRRNGDLRIKGPGLLFCIPGFETVERVSVRPQRLALEFPGIQAGNGAWIAARLDVEFSILQPDVAALVMRQTRLQAAIAQLIELAFESAAGTLAPERLIGASDRKQLGRGIKKAVNETALGWGVDIASIEVQEVREIVAPGAEDNVVWQVLLLTAGEQPLEVIKAISQATELSVLDSKRLLENLPAPLPTAGDAERAEFLRARVEAAGALVVVRRVREHVPGDTVDLANPDTVDVLLHATGPHVLEVISVLRRITGWDLSHTKAVVEQVPYAIMHRVRRLDAEEVKRALESVSAEVHLV